MTDRADTGDRGVRVAMGARVGALAVRALGLTWRVRWEGAEVPRVPAAFALWHGELLPLLWALRGRGIAPLISTHADGEIIARIVESLGYVPIRGSSSRGGARALIEAVRRLGDGGQVAFTTDGPRGPRRHSAPGVLAAATRAQAPVIPLGCVVSRAWRFRSWDRFVLPKPFASIRVRVGEALRPTGEPDVAALDRALLAVCEPDA